MLGPRLEGRNGVALVPPTLEHFRLHPAWEVQPEASRFMGPRFGELTPEKQEKRFKETADGQTQIQWTIAYEGEPVGFTGIFHIDWVRRDGETGLFIGRHDLYGRGIDTYKTNLSKESATHGFNLDLSNFKLGERNSNFDKILSLYQMATRGLPPAP